MLDHRLAMTRAYGASTLDAAYPRFRCAGCAQAVPDRSLRTVAIPYADLAQLRQNTAGLYGSMSAEPPACPACGAASTLEQIDLHAFHAGQGRDLVLCLGEEGVRATSWWDPERGYVPAGRLTPADELGFRLSACARLSAIAPLTGELEALVEATKRLVEEGAGGEEPLLETIPPLLDAGRAGLCARIAAARQTCAPEDPRGHVWMAEILTRCINAGAIPPDAGPDAEVHLDRALELDPQNVQAWLTRGTLCRIRGDDPQARRSYERVLELAPERAEALYNLGIMELTDAPASALERFRRGAELQPEDPDYPLGCARALLALGRRHEAREWVDKARQLAPDHPRVAELEQQSG